ncbi:hypothetical protein ABNX05_14815 [Lysinibacillus sp. M3]|uniref:Uncharacterized protein n=1 Tax=Lysinibacillus zambalensis TaxID=3160866 RepID=A0ABV1MVJ3_9BACI
MTFSLTIIIAIPILLGLLGCAVDRLVLTVFPIMNTSVPHQIIEILLIIIVLLLFIIHFIITK